MLSGATDLAKRPDARGAHGADALDLARLLCRAPGEGATGSRPTPARGARSRCAGRLCTPATVDEVLPAEDRAPAAPQHEEEPAYEQPLLELGLPPAPRALAGEPAELLGSRGLPALWLPVLPRAGAEALARGARPPGGEPARPGLSALLRGTVVHGLLEDLDFGQPVVPSDGEIAAAIELHGVEALAADVEDVRAMLERVASSGLLGRVADADRVRAELPFAFTLDVGGSQPADERGGGRPRRRRRPHPRRRLEERCPRRARARGTHQ